MSGRACKETLTAIEFACALNQHAVADYRRIKFEREGEVEGEVMATCFADMSIVWFGKEFIAAVVNWVSVLINSNNCSTSTRSQWACYHRSKDKRTQNEQQEGTENLHRESGSRDVDDSK